MSARLVIFFTLVLRLCLGTLPTNAQAPSDHTWKFLVEPYLMFPYMNGSTGIGDLPDVSVDADAGDIFSNLRLGAMLYGEASTERWAIGTDILYMNLKQDVSTGLVINDGSVQAKQFAWEVSGLRKLLPWLDVGVGGRFNSLKAGADLITNTTDRSRSTSESWFDPILIARIKNPTEEKLLYQLRSDIGGFGVGADLSWQIQAYVGYRFSPLFQLSAGYRIISIDYEKGQGENRFKYDINTSGPVVRFGFNL
jgi:hypothetical protein